VSKEKKLLTPVWGIRLDLGFGVQILIKKNNGKNNHRFIQKIKLIN
jgi:hypothetical protein